MTQHFNSGKVVLAAIVHELKQADVGSISPGQREQAVGGGDIQTAAAAATTTTTEVKLTKSRCSKLGLLGLKALQKSRSLPRQKQQDEKKNKQIADSSQGANNTLRCNTHSRGSKYSLGKLFSNSSSSHQPAGNDINRQSPIAKKKLIDNSRQQPKLRQLQRHDGHDAAEVVVGDDDGDDKMHQIGHLAGCNRVNEQDQQQLRETSFSQAPKLAQTSHQASDARDQVIEFKFDLIVDGPGLEPLAADSQTAACKSSPSAPAVANGQRKLLDNVNELIESFVLDSSDVCLMSLGDCQPGDSVDLQTNFSLTTTTTTTKTTTNNFDYILQQTRRALIYAFELLHATSAAAASTEPTIAPSATTGDDCNQLAGGGGQTRQQLCNGRKIDDYTIEIGATLIQQRSQSLWFEVIDLMRLSPDDGDGVGHLDQGHTDSPKQLELIECRNLDEASICLNKLQSSLELLADKKDRISTIGGGNYNKNLLLVTLKLKQWIQGGLFHNRMCLMQYDPRLTELSTLFESIFNGQALSHLKRRKIHLETLEFELQKQFKESSCLSLNELDKQHHHVASLRRLIQAEWLLYKQLSSALIKTLILVHVQKVNFLKNNEKTINSHDEPIDITECNMEKPVDNNDNIGTNSNKKQLLEQFIMAHNLNLLEFASLIQRASTSRLKRRKQSLRSHLSNLSINSINSITTTTNYTASNLHNSYIKHHDLMISPTTIMQQQQQQTNRSHKSRPDHHHHQTTYLSNSRPSLIRDYSRSHLDEIYLNDFADNYCDTDDIVPIDDLLCKNDHYRYSRRHHQHHHHPHHHHHHHHKHRQRHHHHQYSGARARLRQENLRMRSARRLNGGSCSGSVSQSRSSSLNRRRSDLTESSSMSTSSSSSNRLVQDVSGRQQVLLSNQNSPLSSTTMVVGGGGGGNNNSNSIAQQGQLVGGVFSDDTDSIASANLNSCSTSTISYNNHQLANCNWPPRMTSQSSNSEASPSTPRSKSRRDIELKWISKQQSSRTMAMVQQQPQQLEGSYQSPSNQLLRQTSGRQLIEDYETDEEIAAALSRQTVSLNDDNLSEVGSIQVTEPPKQLKLEEFLTQLSSIIAPMSKNKSKLESDINANEPVDDNEQHVTQMGPKQSTFAQRQHDDEDDDCKSHSSILEHLSSLATESNIKLQQTGHLQRILNEETSAATRLMRNHESSNNNNNNNLATIRAANQATKQPKMNVEQQLRALTIDCQLQQHQHQRPGVVRSSLDSNCPSSSSSSSAASSSSASSSSEQRMLSELPPTRPTTSTNGVNLYTNPMRHQTNNVRT